MADVANRGAYAGNAVDVRHSLTRTQQEEWSRPIDRTPKTAHRTARTHTMRLHITRLPDSAAIMTRRPLWTDGERTMAMSEEDERSDDQQQAPPAPSGEPMEHRGRVARERDEKEEKVDWTRDPLGGIIWAVILITAGVIFLAETLGWVNWARLGGAWNSLLLAVGVIILIEVLLRLLIPTYRRAVRGRIVFAVILLALGVGNILGPGMIGALFLIILGVGILVRGLSATHS